MIIIVIPVYLDYSIHTRVAEDFGLTSAANMAVARLISGINPLASLRVTHYVTY